MAQTSVNVDGSRRVSSLKAAGVALLAFIVGLLVVGGATTALTMRTREVASLPATPPEFPVVVVAREESESDATCRVMLYGDLASARHKVAWHSFVVEDADVPRCKAQIAAQREIVSEGPAGTLPLWSAAVTFSPVSPDGTQEIGLYATWDDDWVNRGWYLADADGVQPLRYQGYGAGGFLVALSKGVAAGVVSSLIATIAFVRRSKRSLRENRPPAARGS